MRVVSYPISVEYLSAGAQGGLSPALEVELIRGEHRTRAIGVIDSGATITVFNPEHAEILGIENITDGEPGKAQSQAGAVDYYVFDVEMRVQIEAHVKRFPCRVGFFPVRKPRNILGRNFIFGHYEIGFHDSKQTVYLRPED